MVNYRNKLYLINKIIGMEDGEYEDPDVRRDELAELTILDLLKKIEQLKTTQLDSSLWTIVGGD